MKEYLYTRSFNLETGLYNIDYGIALDGVTEEVPLISDIHAEFPEKSINIKCNDTEVKIIINPDLTSVEETTLDNLVASRS